MPDIAVLIPCYNEEKTIEKVISDFRKELPEAEIYVYDNNSTDKTARIAMESGAIVRFCNVQGKGATVKQMLEEIDADVYLLVDGDDTYDAGCASALIQKVSVEGCDMAVADRLSANYKNVNSKLFHNFGNKLVCSLINHRYKSSITDVMTGYRAFSRDFARQFNIQNDGFELETEMTIYALEHHMHVESLPATYRERPQGSHSKINTIKDGIKILKTAIGCSAGLKSTGSL